MNNPYHISVHKRQNPPCGPEKVFFDLAEGEYNHESMSKKQKHQSKSHIEKAKLQKIFFFTLERLPMLVDFTIIVPQCLARKL